MQRSVDDSRRYRVHTDAVLCIFHREMSRDGLNSAFRDHGHRSVHTSYGMVGQRARYADDASASFLRQHLFNRELADVDEAFHVDRSESFEVLGCVLDKRLDDKDTRVIDECIDRAEFAHRNLGDCCSSSARTDVSVDQRQLIRRRECARLGHVPGRRDHGVASLEKSFHYGRSDALRSTGYDDCPRFVRHIKTPLYPMSEAAAPFEWK